MQDRMIRTVPVCLNRDGRYVCTLPTGHRGPHEAWNGDGVLVDEWPNRRTDDDDT